MRMLGKGWHILTTRGFVYSCCFGIHALSYYMTRLNTKIITAYYRVLCGSMGHGVVIRNSANITMPGKCFIGNYSSINAGCHIASQGTIRIGNYVMVGPRTIMWSQNHVFDRTDIPMREQGHSEAPIVIEDDVWIGARCIILAGIRIGTGSVIGAGAVVTHDIPPYSVVAGVPAWVIRPRIKKPPTPWDAHHHEDTSQQTIAALNSIR